MMNNPPKVLLFDLGGVVLPWVGPEALAASHCLTRAEVIARFEASDIFNAYERGEVGDAVFTAELARLFDLGDVDIAALWNSWVHPPFPDVIEALAELKSKYTLACLSNTNALHWAHVNTLIDTAQMFHHAYASHEINLAKPDPEAYRFVLQKMVVAAEDVWFFEDTTVNIESAREIGLTVHAVDRKFGVIPVLKNLGLIA